MGNSQPEKDENGIHQSKFLSTMSKASKMGTMKQAFRRQGRPSENVAIGVQALSSKFRDSRSWEIFQSKIFTVKNLENKRKSPLEMKTKPIPENQIKQPFYIPSLKCFYVGEWVYDEGLDDNVPGGLGRLYENECIAEGNFKTTLNTHVSGVQKLNLDMGYIIRPKSKEELYEELNQQLMTANSRVIMIKLNGTGRIYNRDEELSGNFEDGKLHGQGIHKYRTSSEDYMYEGDWKHGVMHGKGKEKTKLTEYDGYFKNGIKHGKGTQIFLLSNKQELERKTHEEALRKMIAEDGDEMRETVRRELTIKNEMQERVLHALRRYPWKRISTDPSMFETENFYYDRKYTKMFLETYEGEFKNDEMNGKGVYVWWDGKTYNGDWKKGKMHGKGEFWWPDGSIFRGEYQEDQRHGEGMMIWKLQTRYRGFWAFGVRHGYGEAIEIDAHENLTIKGCIWKQDKIQQVKFSKNLKIEKINILRNKLKNKKNAGKENNEQAPELVE